MLDTHGAIPVNEVEKAYFLLNETLGGTNPLVCEHAVSHLMRAWKILNAAMYNGEEPPAPWHERNFL